MTTTYKGASIFYTIKGQGDALILLHGFLENSNMWSPFITQLSQEYRVICIDLLGHGNTQCTGYVHTMEEMAAAVNGVLDVLNIQNISIIGHSMGGYVGCAFAKAYPEKLKALCLLNSTPLPDDSDRKLLRTRANKMAKENYHQMVRMSFINLFDPKTQKTHNKKIAQGIKEAMKTPVQGYIAGNSGMRLREDSSLLWKEGDFYKGFILGENDWIIDSIFHKALFKKESHFFEVIPGGHMSHLGQQKKTINSIREFLKNSKNTRASTIFS